MRTAISTAQSSNLSLPATTFRYLNASTCLSLLCELRRVQPFVRGDTFAEVVPLLHTLACLRADAPSLLCRKPRELRHCICESRRVACRQYPAGSAYDLAAFADVGADCRQTHRHRLANSVGKCFAPLGGEAEAIASREDLAHVGQLAEQRYLPRHA